MKYELDEVQPVSSSWDFESLEGADGFKACRVTLLRTVVLEIILTVGLDASAGMGSIVYCHSKPHNTQTQNFRGRQECKHR